RVVLNGWGIGETHDGGLAERIQVKGDWLVEVPPVFTARQAAAIGTAGLTAALSADALESHGLKPDDGEVLVTGATGGVGSLSIALLSRRGYHVVASSGRPQHNDYLLSLGAERVIGREALNEEGRPLQSQLWSGAIDSVGGRTLATILSQLNYRGTVAACGLAS